MGQARLPIIIPHSLPTKRPLATLLQVTMETRSVVWGSGVVKRCRQPLAAHSPVINDHPCGSDSGPGEKQKWSLLSESDGKYVQGLDRGAEVACVEFGKM